MKKTLIALLTLGSLAMAEDITYHGITFTAMPDGPMHGVNPKDVDYYITEARYGNGGTAVEWGGIAILEGAGYKINASNCHPTFTHLYIDPSLQFKVSTSSLVGQINWTTNNDNAYFLMSSAEGAWVDINAAYGNNIHVEAMSNGTVYLNAKGSLTSTLPNTNKVEAELLTSGYEGISGYSYDDATQVLTRTLMTGDFTGWDATANNVILTNLQALDPTKLQYIADAQGLRVTYDMSSVPEPMTGTLSLLALAGLCIRRRK